MLVVVIDIKSKVFCIELTITPSFEFINLINSGLDCSASPVVILSTIVRLNEPTSSTVIITLPTVPV